MISLKTKQIIRLMFYKKFIKKNLTRIKFTVDIHATSHKTKHSLLIINYHDIIRSFIIFFD